MHRNTGRGTQYLALVLGCVLALTGCGDNAVATPDAGPGAMDLLGRLRALPNVHDAAEQPTQAAGYHYVVLHFTQPVDHEDPHSATFLQEVSLLHKDETSPLIVHTSGYWDYYLDRTVELTQLLSANQISIEHRFFAGSRPAPADWTKLTIKQMAADEHAIVTALRTIYTGKALSTGGSKGGMTAIFYRRFYPDDVDGTVPYVAPISFAAPDTRYPAFIDTVGTAACRQAVRDAATEMLAHRRTVIEGRAQAQAQAQALQYTRIAIGPAVESAIDSVEWAFWQYFGIGMCNAVPGVGASDDAMWGFLDQISPVSDNDDAQVGQFDAYYYQAYDQLGYPDGGAAYLRPYLIYTDADYLASLPTAQPAYDMGVAMHDIDDFVQQHGDRLLFIYGQWDPWTGGKFELGSATDSLRLIQPQGTHGSRIGKLATADKTAALAKLAAWTGVTPVSAARTFAAEPRSPRVPPAMVRALRARRVSP
ncbi:MAG: putative secreted tripeptidyl aminopeptidase [Myxococcales bacterium]|nr:putative secreted tripeptidyl aminopeptidase [Myxococcales bacterium]